MLINIVEPNAYSLDKNYSTSLTTGCVTEAYLNGGIIGILLSGLLHGFLIASVTRYGARIRWRYQYVVYLVSALFFGEMLVYGEFSGCFARWGILLVPIVLYCGARRALGIHGLSSSPQKLLRPVHSLCPALSTSNQTGRRR